MNHGGGQPVHHADPDLIRLDAGAVGHTLRAHAVDRAHLAPGEAHHVQVEDTPEGADDLFFGESLEEEAAVGSQ